MYIKNDDWEWSEDGITVSREELTYDEFIKGKGDKMSSKFTNVIDYKRGDKYSVMVGYNSYEDHISFHNIVMPDEASKDVRERFLADAEAALLLIIEAEVDKSYNKYGNYGGE